MFLIDDKVIFIHFPKAGGTLIRRTKFEKKELILKLRHTGITLLPQKYINYPIFGLVRNPFSFYVSFYFYFRNNKHLNDYTSKVLFCKYFKKSKNINFNNFDLVKEDFEKQITLLINKGNEHNIPIENKSYGLVTRLHSFLYEKNCKVLDNITVFKYEELYKVNKFLKSYSINEVNLNKRVNKRKFNYGNYKDYYSEDLIKLIKLKEKPILDKYNYSF